MDEIIFKRTELETWADQFKESFKVYQTSDQFLQEAKENPVIELFAKILIDRVEVSEINYEIMIRDMGTGTDAFYEKDNIKNSETLGRLMAEFARKIATYEYEKSKNKPVQM